MFTHTTQHSVDRLNMFRGIPIYPSILIPQEKQAQYRFPKTKKHRIQKKWAKDPDNFKPTDVVFYDAVNKRIYCHPGIAIKLSRALNGLENSQPLRDPTSEGHFL